MYQMGPNQNTGSKQLQAWKWTFLYLNFAVRAHLYLMWGSLWYEVCLRIQPEASKKCALHSVPKQQISFIKLIYRYSSPQEHCDFALHVAVSSLDVRLSTVNGKLRKQHFSAMAQWYPGAFQNKLHSYFKVFHGLPKDMYWVQLILRVLKIQNWQHRAAVVKVCG